MPRDLPTNVALLFHVVPSAAWFSAALRHVGRLFRFVGAEDVAACVAGGRPLHRACHVHFDDGVRAVWLHAFPVLREMGVPATVFVSPSAVEEESNFWFQDLDTLVRCGAAEAVRAAALEAHPGDPATLARCPTVAILKSMRLAGIRRVIETAAERSGVALGGRRNVNRAEVEAMRASGLVTFGAHTLDHPILANETDEEAHAQVVGSVRRLGALLGEPVRHFAYPNGDEGLDFGPREKALLAGCGVTAAFSAYAGFFGPRSDPYAIPRAGLSGSPREGWARIAAKLLLTPAWDRVRVDGQAWRERRARERPARL